MNTRLIVWCDRLIKSGFYLLFGLVPLLLTPLNYELFEYNKMMAVYVVASIVVASWIVKSIQQKEIRIARTPLDIPIALFVTSQFVSAIFSIDPHVSWFGYYSRFNGGLWSVISYVLLYYAFLSNLEAFSLSAKNEAKTPSPTHIPNTIYHLLRIALVSASLVAIYGVLERLGIDKRLWVQDVQNRVFSTLGQPNWLAAYLVALMPLSMAMGVIQLTGNNSLVTKKATMQEWMKPTLYGLLSVLFFVVLLFTKSRSGLFGLIVADILFWGLMVLKKLPFPPFKSPSNPPKQNQGSALKWGAGGLHVIFALIIFIHGTGTPAIDKWITFNGLKTIPTNVTKTTKTQEATPSTVTGPALETGGTESGVIRKYVWQGAINAWNSSWKTRFIGTGTETFAFTFYKFRPVAHNLTSEWDFLYNKAHNEYLNYLATTGIFGLGSYVLFIGVFVVWFIRYALGGMRYAENKQSLLPVPHTSLLIPISLFSGWLSILVTNFFGFSVVIQQVFLFLFPAIIFALLRSDEDAKKRSFSLRIAPWLIWAPILVCLYVLIKIGSFWYADTRYAQGYRMSRAGLYAQAIPALILALRLNPKEPMYHDELGSAYATLSVATFEGKNATQAAQLAALAVEESIRAISTSPNNVNFYKTRTKIYYTLSALEATFNAKAVETLTKAIPLSPNDPKIFYNLAILVGREGDTNLAIKYLLKAKELKPNYRDAYYALWVFFTEEKQPADAKGILNDYLVHIDPNDQQFKDLMNK